MTLSQTNIEWTDFPWNCVTGCFNTCKYCYARKLANWYLKRIYLKNNNFLKVKRKGNPEKDPFWPRFWENRLNDPSQVPKKFRSKNPNLSLGSAMLFVVDMGELFGPWVPQQWIERILIVVQKYPQHIFQFLTKYPQTLSQYEFPQNAWVGTTVTTIDEVLKMNILATKCKAKIKYISFEPLLSDIFPKDDFLFPMLKFIDWIIVGAQTGPGREKHFPESQWVQNIIRAAGAYDIPIFLKDNLYFKDSLIQTCKIQEFPEVVQ